MITIDTSGLIDPATVNKDSVFLYKLTATGPEAAARGGRGGHRRGAGLRRRLLAARGAGGDLDHQRHRPAAGDSDSGADAARRHRHPAARGRHRVRGGDHRQRHRAGRHQDRPGDARAPPLAEQPAAGRRHADGGRPRRRLRRAARADAAGPRAGARRPRHHQGHHPRPRDDGVHLPHPEHHLRRADRGGGAVRSRLHRGRPVELPAAGVCSGPERAGAGDHHHLLRRRQLLVADRRSWTVSTTATAPTRRRSRTATSG